MRKMLSCTFILTLLGGTSLWAVRGYENGRNYNRDLQKRSGHANWGKCLGLDSDDSLLTGASIEVDNDSPWEWPPQGYGVDYSAQASVSGTGYGGSYFLYASVPDDSDSASGDTEGYTYDFISASYFDWGHHTNAQNALANCSAYGEISGSTSGSDPYLHRSRAEAWKFSQMGES